MRKPRVLVVDDSAFARSVLTRILRSTGTIDVLGTARDGRDALAQIAALDPDLITLDLTMPDLGGIDVLRALQGRARPRVLVVSISSVDTELGAEALSLGAIDIVTKPTALATARLNELGDELIAKVLAATQSILDPVAQPRGTALQRSTVPAELVMIGTSTGGPQALSQVVAKLPATLAAPVAIVLHIPVGFTEALAARLDRLSPLQVIEGFEGLELRPGLVVLARGGEHLRIERHGTALVCRLSTRPIQPFTPSVDVLFESGASAVGARGLGVVLTGMGDDGLAGSRKLAAAGGSLLTESPTSCIVYGMPRCVFEAGIGAASVPLGAIADEIAKRA
ncbi:MAG: chemotaxis-specific protein-glutamate methyltransferase CheB [Kofleriaceae bacterium]